MPFKNDSRQRLSVTFSALIGEGMNQKIDALRRQVDQLSEAAGPGLLWQLSALAPQQASGYNTNRP